MKRKPKQRAAPKASAVDRVAALETDVRRLKHELAKQLEIRRLIVAQEVARSEVTQAQERFNLAAQAVRAWLFRDEAERRPNYVVTGPTTTGSSLVPVTFTGGFDG